MVKLRWQLSNSNHDFLDSPSYTNLIMGESDLYAITIPNYLQVKSAKHFSKAKSTQHFITNSQVSNRNSVKLLFNQQSDLKSSQKLSIENLQNYLIARIVTNLISSNRSKIFDFSLTLRLSSKFQCYWVPHLKNTSSDIIGEHSFRNPALLFTSDQISFLIHPVIRAQKHPVLLRPYFDYTVQNQNISIIYGVSSQKSYDHVFFTRKTQGHYVSKKDPNSHIKLDLIIVPISGSITQLLQLYSQFSGIHYLSSYLKNNIPEDPSLLANPWFKSKSVSKVPKINGCQSLVKPFQNFIVSSFDCYFSTFNGWEEFKLNEEPCGGMIMRSFTGASRGKYTFINTDEQYAKLWQENRAEWKLSYKMLHRWYQRPWMYWIIRGLIRFVPLRFPAFIWNNAWFLQIRTAYGLYYWGKSLKRLDYVDKAQKMKNLIHQLPDINGLFPIVCLPTENGDTRWINSSKAFLFTEAFHLADIALTLYWLIRLESDLEGKLSDNTLQRSMKTAELLLSLQRESGAFPSFVDNLGRSEDVFLGESAESGAIGMFLLLLYQFTEEIRYLDAGKKVANFLSTEIIPQNRWLDFETLYSCPQLNQVWPNWKNSLDIYPQNNLSISWAIEMYRLLYVHSKNDSYFVTWQHLLDYLALFQQVWDPPFLDVFLPGGFGCMNIDGEWSDIRQACFSRMYFESFLETHRKDHLVRSIAALHASFPLILDSDNKNIASGNFRLISSKDYGVAFENYGHQGWNAGTVGLTTVDWGIGTAFFAAAYFRHHWGDLFIDFTSQNVCLINYGTLNGVDFSDDTVSISLNLSLWKADLPFKVKWNSEKGEEKIILQINSNKYLFSLQKGVSEWFLDTKSFP